METLEARRGQLLASLGLTLEQRDRSLLCLGILWFFAGVEYAVILPTLWLYLQELQMAKHWFLGVVLSAFAAASMISAPVFGLYADKGRIKRLLVAASVFMVVGNLLYFIADDGYVVLEGRFIAGWGAGVASASFAYLARVSLREERTRIIGSVMAARQLGLLFGPCLNFGMTHLHVPLGPYEINNLTVPGILMAVLWAFTGVLSIFLFQDIDVPTSSPGTRVASRRVSRQPSYNNLAAHVQASERTALLGAESRATSQGSEAMVPQAIAEDLSEEEQEQWEYVPMPTRYEEYTQLPVLALFLVSFLCIFNQLALETWVTPFTQAYFDWHEQENSILYMLVGLVAVSMFLLIRVLVNRGMDDRQIMVIGLVFEFLGLGIAMSLLPFTHPKTDFALFVFVPTVFFIVAGLPFLFVPVPALQSKLTSEETQGFGQGLRRTVVSMGTIVGPLWAGLMSKQVYGFLGLMLGLLVIAVGIFIAMYRRLLPDDDMLTLEKRLSMAHSPSSPPSPSQPRKSLG